MVLLLSGRPEVQILLATSKEIPRILGFQSSRYFTISEFANQNGVSANYPKILLKISLIEKARVFSSRL